MNYQKIYLLFISLVIISAGRNENPGDQCRMSKYFLLRWDSVGRDKSDKMREQKIGIR